MIDVARALRMATDSGDVRFGVKEVAWAVKAKSAKLVVLASNCPKDRLGNLGGVKVYEFAGTNVELGASCGVPFSVSAMAVLSPGESNILSL